MMRLRISVLCVCAGLQVSVASAQVADEAPMIARDSSQEGESRASGLAHVEVRGTGPIPLVLIPDLGFDWMIFEEFMSDHLDEYTMYAVTLPGFGGSPPPGEISAYDFISVPWIQSAADGVAAALAERGVESAVLVGHGLGGVVAAIAGGNHPSVARGVVMVDVFPTFPVAGVGNELALDARAAIIRDQMLPRFQAASAEEWEEASRQQTVMSVKDPELGARLANIVLANEKDVMVRYNLEMMACDASPALITAPFPTLIVVPLPKDDAQFPAAQRRGMWQELVPDAEKVSLTFIDDSRHQVMLDQPEAFSTRLAEFCADLD